MSEGNQYSSAEVPTTEKDGTEGTWRIAVPEGGAVSISLREDGISGITIVKKESHPRGPSIIGFHVFPDEGIHGGEAPGGHPDFGATPTPPSVDSGGTTTREASTGDGEPTMGTFPHFVIVPWSITIIDFSRTKWMTDCLELLLAITIGGVPATTPIRVGFRGFVNKTLTSGLEVTPRHAQYMVAGAASEAADTVERMLTHGTVGPFGAPDKFREVMNKVFEMNGQNANVVAC
jgi:hypothetical protein